MRAAARVASICALLSFAGLAARLEAAGQWEVEVHGGVAASSNPTHGNVSLPLANGTLSAPVPDSARIVSSWMFADGAAQLNRSITSQPFGAGVTIVPLDAILQSRFAERQTGASFGLRISHPLSARFAAEFSIDHTWAPLDLAGPAQVGVQLTRLTFENSMNGLLGGPAARLQSVTAAATVNDRRGGQLTTSGALVTTITTSTRLTPYFVVGGAAIARTGAVPSAQLTGHYQLSFPPSPPPVPILIPTILIDENDRVSVRTVVHNRFALSVGGGFKYPLAGRVGLRIDLRDQIYRDPQSTEIDATPSTQQPGGALALGGAPRLVFGGSSFLRPTLSGAPIVGFETFRGTDLQNQLTLTGGLFWKF